MKMIQTSARPAKRRLQRAQRKREKLLLKPTWRAKVRKQEKRLKAARTLS